MTESYVDEITSTDIGKVEEKSIQMKRKIQVKGIRI